jgi:hypothetical protein
MKKHVCSAFLILSIISLIILSCKTTHPEAPGGPGEPAATVEGLQDVVSKVQEARKRAMDFESPQYFPTDWEVVEARNGAATILPKATPEEVEKARDLYTTVAGEYDALFQKAVQLYAQAREDEVMAERDKVVGTEFADAFPEYLEKADDLALSALDQYEAKDYYTAKNTAVSALAEYSTLALGAGVFSVRQEIINRGFNIYDSENFIEAEAIGDAALDEYEDGNRTAAEGLALEAETHYRTVIANSWTFYAEDKQGTASAEKKRATDNKAHIAAKELYNEADGMYAQAEIALNDKKYEEAAIFYTDAEALFIVAARETERKRTRAVDTIKLAAEKIEESNETALEVEKLIEGGIK